MSTLGGKAEGTKIVTCHIGKSALCVKHSTPDLRLVTSGEYPDFTYAAETSVQAVVFVKVVKRSEGNQIPPSIFDYFFGFCLIVKLHITELQLKHIIANMPAPP